MRSSSGQKTSLRRGSVRTVCSSSLIATMPDLSHAACLWEAGPTGGAPNDADHVAVYESTSGSSGKPIIIIIIIIIIFTLGSIDPEG